LRDICVNNHQAQVTLRSGRGLQINFCLGPPKSSGRLWLSACS